MISLYQTTTVGVGGAATIEWTSIPQTGRDILLVVSPRSTTTNVTFSMFANGDLTVTNYNQVNFVGASGITTAIGNNAQVATMNPSTAVANSFGAVSILIPNYTSGFLKRALIDAVQSSSTATPDMRIGVWAWTGTSAITSLRLSDFTFAQNTTASLYLIS